MAEMVTSPFPSSCGPHGEDARVNLGDTLVACDEQTVHRRVLFDPLVEGGVIIDIIHAEPVPAHSLIPMAPPAPEDIKVCNSW